MNLNPVWHIHVERGLIEHEGRVTKQEECGCQIVVLFLNEFIHVRKAYANATSAAEADAEEIHDVVVDTVREGHHDV